MKAVRVIELLNGIIDGLNLEEASFIREVLDNKGHACSTKQRAIIKAMQEAQEELRKDLAKKDGTGNQLKVVKRTIKTDKSKRFDGCAPTENGKQYIFTNGYYVLKLNTSFGYKYLEGTIVKTLNDFFIRKECGTSYKIDLLDLRTFVSNAKASKDKKAVYRIKYDEKNEIGFNGNYLLDCLEAVGTDTIIILGAMKPIHGANETTNESFVLCPIRIKEEK